MTVRMLFLLGLLFLSACGKEPYHGQGWSADFAPYVERFRAEAVAHNREIDKDYWTALTVQFGNPSAMCKLPNLAGCCETRSDGSKTIVIDYDYWRQSSQVGRYGTLLHELGHCLLDREHRSDFNKDGHPASIMYPMVPSGSYFQDHIGLYLNELFDK